MWCHKRILNRSTVNWQESQSVREDKIQAIWRNSMSVRLPAPYPGLGHGGQAATATRGPQSPRHHSLEPVPPRCLGEIPRWTKAGREISCVQHVLYLSRTLVLDGHSSAVSNSSHTRCKCMFSVHIGLSVDAPRIFMNHSVSWLWCPATTALP